MAVIALVVTFVAAVHPGSTPPLTGTPHQIVVASATRTAAANTVHMKLTLSATGTPSFAGQSGKPVSVSVSAEGASDFAHKLATLTVRAPRSSGKGTEVTQMRIIGPAMYLNAPGLRSVDGGKPWVQVGLAQYEQKEGTSGVGFFVSGNGDLTQFLAQLRQHSSSITKVGPATIDGVATNHYRAMLTGTATSTSSSGAPVSGTASLPVDVWVDGQGRLSQLRLQLPFFGIEMSETVTLSDYDSALSVTPPPANQTANGAGLLKSGGLDQVLGNSSGGSSSSATGSGTTAPTTAAGTSAMSDVTITQCQVDANDSTLADVGGTIVNHDTQTDDYFIHVTLLEGSTPVGGGSDNENAIPPGQTSDWSTYGSVTPGSGSNLTCQLDEVDRTSSS